MNNTLKELWSGNLYPCESIRITTPEYKEATKRFYDLQEKLEAALSKEQFHQIEELLGFAADMASHFEAEAFCSGFRLGSRLTYEVFDADS